jgi:hypothetical protein
MHRVAATIVVLLLCTFVAYAGGDEPLFSRIGEKTLLKILDRSKVEWEKKTTTDKSGKETHHYLVKFSDGWKATMVNHGSYLSIASLGLKSGKLEEVPLERINEWNLRYGGFTTACLSREGNAFLMSAHDMKPGTNEKIIGNWVTQFSLELAEFARFVR